MPCTNTAVCWSCSAPFSIHFAVKDDALGLPALSGLTEKDGVLTVAIGSVRKPFRSEEVVLCVPSFGCDLEFRIEERHIKKIVDGNGQPIYE